VQRLVPSWLEVKVLSSSVCHGCKSGWEETLEKFGQGVIVIYAPVGDRVNLVFVMAFINGLYEGELPIGRLHVGFPYASEE